jgi:hypothetical protein
MVTRDFTLNIKFRKKKRKAWYFLTYKYHNNSFKIYYIASLLEIAPRFIKIPNIIFNIRMGGREFSRSTPSALRHILYTQVPQSPGDSKP